MIQSNYIEHTRKHIMTYTFPALLAHLSLSLHRRPNKMDSNAWHLCQMIRSGAVDSVAVEWTPSKTWGATAKVESNAGKCSLASGCGYHKGSAALAEALRFLGRDDSERIMIHGTSGCGYSAVCDALESVGYALKHVHTGSGKYGSEVFSITRID